MRNHFYILPLLLLAGACQSNSHRSYGDRPTVAEKTLLSVPASARNDINKERTARTEAVDRVALAELEVQRAEERVNIAQKDVSIAKDELGAAEDRVELAREGNESDRDDRIQSAIEKRDATRAHMEWTRCQVMVEEGRVTKAQAQVAVAKQHVALADAKIELAKAEAVQDLDRKDYDSIDVNDFQRCVAEEEASLKMAEIDAKACEDKLEVRQKLLEARAKAVPASYRKS